MITTFRSTYINTHVPVSTSTDVHPYSYLFPQQSPTMQSSNPPPTATFATAQSTVTPHAPSTSSVPSSVSVDKKPVAQPSATAPPAPAPPAPAPPSSPASVVKSSRPASAPPQAESQEEWPPLPKPKTRSDLPLTPNRSKSQKTKDGTPTRGDSKPPFDLDPLQEGMEE